jgi:hypothetical protein
MRLDLTGQRFGRLTVIGVAPASRGGRTQWTCLCDCHREHVASTASLRGGDVRSCGCLRRDVSRQTTLKNIKAGAMKRYRLKRALAEAAIKRYQQPKQWRGAAQAVQALEKAWS